MSICAVIMICNLIQAVMRRPESQGLVCASIYIISLILFTPYAFSESITTHNDTARRAREGLVVDEFPHHQVCNISSSSMLNQAHCVQASNIPFIPTLALDGNNVRVP